jgi:hypothetical protein
VEERGSCNRATEGFSAGEGESRETERSPCPRRDRRSLLILGRSAKGVEGGGGTEGEGTFRERRLDHDVSRWM